MSWCSHHPTFTSVMVYSTELRRRVVQSVGVTAAGSACCMMHLVDLEVTCTARFESINSVAIGIERINSVIIGMTDTARFESVNSVAISVIRFFRFCAAVATAEGYGVVLGKCRRVALYSLRKNHS